jgi:hypothetical protein
MLRSPLAALLALSVVIAARGAHAQDAPPLPQPEPPVAPALPAQPVPVVQPAPYPAPAPPPYFAPPPSPYVQPPTYVLPPGHYAYAPDEERHGPMNWYGWQTLIAVAPFDVAMFISLAHLSEPGGMGTFVAAFAGRNLAPAVVHLAHGKVATAFGSVGLHIASTATGLAIGYGLGIASQSSCKVLCGAQTHEVPAGAGIGAVVGSISGTAFDVVFFAHRQRLVWTASAPPPPERPAWGFAPYAAPGGAGLAAAGIF